MQQQQPPRPSRNTPRKGRARRDSTQTPRNIKPAKKYASENDIPRDSNGIRTPRKGTPGASNHANLSFKGNSVGNSQRNRNKGRPTSIATGSPAQVRQDRASPPLTADKTAAYAGATYHASPDPSSIPIPSFLKKASSSPSRSKTVGVSQEPSPPTSDSETPSPTLPSSLRKDQQEQVQESPLDFFFKKDREEKERRRASSAQGLMQQSRPYSPPDQSPLRSGSGDTPPTDASTAGSRASFVRGAAAGISPEELNGTPSRILGPSFSTPFHERIQAAKNGGLPAQASPVAIEQTPDERSQALKTLLKIKSSTSGDGSGQPPASFSSGPNPFAPGRNAGNASAPRQSIQGPSTGGQVTPVSDAVTMTNSLKNLLRIK